MNNQYSVTPYYPPQYSSLGQAPNQPLATSTKWILGGIALVALISIFGSNASFTSRDF